MPQNLLVILSVEHQSRALSGLGHFCQTPNLDRLMNLAGSAAASAKQAEMNAALLNICDPEEMNRLAFSDQAALIASHGGREAALKLGAPGAPRRPKSDVVSASA